MIGSFHLAALLARVFVGVKYRQHHHPRTVSGSALLSLIGALLVILGGCGNRPETPAEQKQMPQAGSQTQLEKCMTTWKSGDKDAAVQAFLDMDFSKPLFSADSSL